MIKEAIEKIQNLVLAGTAPVMLPNANVAFDMARGKTVPEAIFNDWAKRPDRIRQNVTVLDPASYVEYYSTFRDDNSRTFGDEAQLQVTGILDYHAPTATEDGNTPRWGSHRVTLKLRQSEEFKVWSGSNNKSFTQTELAEFLEQYASDISSPSPASIVEIANDLQAKTEVDFVSTVKMQNGNVRLKYTETTKATVGAGEVAVPDRFTLSIPIFVGADRVPMEALLRFRINSGKLTFRYTLIRPEAVVRAGFQAASQKIADDLKLTIISGSPA